MSSPTAPKYFDLMDISIDTALLNTVFHRNEWIKSGKTFHNAPAYIVDTYECKLSIPFQVILLLPPPTMPIVQFCSLPLPVQSQSLNTFASHAWCSDSPSTMSVEDCFHIVTHCSIPSQEVLEMLKDDTGQQWLDGAKSIVDPRYNKGRDLLPFMVLQLWKELARMYKAQKEWKESYKNVQKAIQDENVSMYFLSPGAVFDQHGWDMELWLGQWTFTTLSFTRLLRPVMIDDDTTQAMNHILNVWLAESDFLKTKHYLAPSRFALVLCAAVEKRFQKLPRTLREVEAVVAKSPGVKKGQSVMGIVLISRAPKSSSSMPNNGSKKKDHISCIPVTMNTIAHGILNDPLWDHGSWWLHRIQWWVKLADRSCYHSTSPTITSALVPTLKNLLNNTVDDEMVAWDDIGQFFCDDWDPEVFTDSRDPSNDMDIDIPHPSHFPNQLQDHQH
ncbi:hypothetical protein BDP27DRAFT_1424723 [Rhodocollybia butyracea]|uniref:Uncharacterized protein n=1 Tax=Rhodocollybia butyracea TaxID=206335 RepID=A0A9P5PHM9_9AGAR|nr:hypothetical protein BDP27DRAFT_1424723 [Rhodocollybia butyracea]